jgi:hypothetical protein
MIFRNTARTKLTTSLEGAGCPDPCGGCNPITNDDTDEPCLLITLAGVEAKQTCSFADPFDGSIYLTVTALSTAGINSSFRVEPIRFDQVPGIYSHRDGLDNGIYISTRTNVLYKYVFTDPFYDPYTVFLPIMATNLQTRVCADGRTQIVGLIMWVVDEFENTGERRRVFLYSWRETDAVWYYAGDAIPNEHTDFDCPFRFDRTFKGGTATVTIPETCGVEEPKVFEAVDCATETSSIFVAIENNPDPGNGLPYFPKNGGVLYRPIDPLTSSPQTIGTTWVQEECAIDVWPTVSRCDGLAGQLTFDPADRPPGGLTFTVSSVEYYVDGDESRTPPSAGTWSSESCFPLQKAVRCAIGNVDSLPIALQSAIPSEVAYDPALLKGGTPSDFTTIIQFIIEQEGTGGVRIEYCVFIPYVCTSDSATPGAYLVTNLQNFDCGELPNDLSQNGELCPPNTGDSCTDCCGTDAFPACCNESGNQRCMCCLGVPPE